MASSDPKIKDGFPLPLWMKTKPTKDFEPFAASPPSPEDSFFVIRYPKKDMLFGKNKLEQGLPKILTDQPSQLPDAYNIKDKDWTKHTKPCQDVLHGITPINAAIPTSSKTTEDGSKEGAACGTSVVKVAQQMMSSNRSPRGFTVAEPEEEAEAPSSHYLAARRSSRSLPASPLSSPTSRRKKTGNRYFTSPFEPTEDANNRSWLTMALLGFKKDLASSSSTLAEEDAIEARLHGGSLAESVQSLGPAPPQPPRREPRPSPAASTLKPKPTELRELNFWSPTSM